MSDTNEGGSTAGLGSEEPERENTARHRRNGSRVHCVLPHNVFGGTHSCPGWCARLRLPKEKLKCLENHDSEPGERVVRKYRISVTEGTLRAGMNLPKLRNISQDLGVSGNTVTKALRELEQEGLVHKIGKSWIAGPKRKKISDSSTAQYVILLVG